MIKQLDFKIKLIIVFVTMFLIAVVMFAFCVQDNYALMDKFVAFADDFDGYEPILDAEDLNNIRNDLTGKYYLANDIDLADVSWTPIGTEERPFLGELEGNGHIISNLNNISTSDAIGLFAYNAGVIKNINVSEVFELNIEYKGSSNVVPYTIIAGVVAYNHGQLFNCGSIYEITARTKGTLGPRLIIGGLVSENEGSIKYCYANGTISIQREGYNQEYIVGGLVGRNNGTIESSISEYNVYTTGDDRIENNVESYLGGLCGYNFSDINRSYANGIIKCKDGTSVYGGGFSAINAGTICNSFANGDTEIGVGSGNQWVKLAAQAYGFSSNAGEIVSCYSSGAVNAFGDGASIKFGGFSDADVTNCFYIDENGNYIFNDIEVKNDEFLNILKNSWDERVWDFYHLSGQGVPVLQIIPISGVQNTNYISARTIIFDVGMAWLNKQIFYTNQEVSKVGNYALTLCFNGYYQQIDFVIDPIILGADEGGEYSSDIRISINDGDVFLNGLPYQNEEEITSIGYYTLTVRGVNDYEKSIQFTLTPTISNLSENGEYTGSVQPIINKGEVFLDGNSFISETIISQVGNHTIEIVGLNDYCKRINFILHPEIDSITDGAEYIGSITPQFSDGTIYLNNEIFYSGDTIAQVGNHIISIHGVNGYSKELNFTLMPKIQDIEDGGIYQGHIAPHIEGGNIKLDGANYDGCSKIAIPGLHVIEISGRGEFKISISFEVQLVYSGIEDEGEYILFCSPDFSGGTILLDGVSYTPNTKVEEVGYHTFVILGSNEFVKEIRFVVNPKIEGLEDGGEYVGKVVPVIIGGVLDLDGAFYDGSSIINMPGNHKITIKGTGDYFLQINFTVTLVVNGLNDEQKFEYGDIVKPTFSGGKITLNGEPFSCGAEIKNVGNYTFIVSGVNEFKRIISFTILPVIANIVHNGNYDGEVTPKILGGTISLDGKQYDGISTITMPGNHQIDIIGEGDYNCHIEFHINLIFDGIENGKIYYGALKPNISGGIVFLNGEEYIIGTIINNVGNYTLKILDAQKVELICNFQIYPIISNLENDKVYEGAIIPSIVGGNILLDGERYDGISEISTPGDHLITIAGEGNFNMPINFYINLVWDEITAINNFGIEIIPYISGGLVTLNGEEYLIGSPISAVGNYTLTVAGINGFTQTQTFSILPIVENIMEDENYSGSITPSIKGGNIYLNNTVYDGNSPITIPGRNIITVYGCGGFVKTINFYINVLIAGLSDNEEYSGKVEFSISGGKIVLDGIVFESDCITMPGKHCLEIFGNEDYYIAIAFSVKEIVEGFSANEVTTREIVPLISGGNVKLNGEPFASGTVVDNIGKYTLTVDGANGYSKDYQFEIIPIVYNAEFNENDNNIEFVLTAANKHSVIMFDGEKKIKDFNCNTIGNHELVIRNGDYVEKKNFTIKSNYPIVNGHYDKAVQIKHIENGKIVLDGKEVTKDIAVDTHGSHRLVIIGVNGYEEVYEFTYDNPYYKIVPWFGAIVGLLIVGMIVLFILRRKKI